MRRALGAERFSCIRGVEEFVFGGGDVVVALRESFVECTAHPGAVCALEELGESVVRISVSGIEHRKCGYNFVEVNF